MPELPEVEVTKQALFSNLIDKKIYKVIVRSDKLRWPVTRNLADQLHNLTISHIERRAKFILIHFHESTKKVLLIHLGMSGRLYILKNIPIHTGKHDHIDFIFSDGYCLRFTDPRRFGTVLLIDQPINEHALLCHLGPEPLMESWSPYDLLQNICRSRRNIKTLLMDAKVVVGIGNIYVNEILFRARISPFLLGVQCDLQDCIKIVQYTRTILSDAITKGGTTIKDFSNTEGKPGYFTQDLQVYGRENALCNVCGNSIKKIILNQRSTYYCSICQNC